MTDRPQRGMECARCGACTVACPVFRVRPRESLTARGKMHLLSLPLADQPSARFQDIFSCCLLCGACEDVCSRSLPLTERFIRAREDFPPFYGSHGLEKTLVRQVLKSPTLLQRLVRAGLSLKGIRALPADSGLRLKLGLLEEPPSGKATVAAPKTEPEAELQYFTGCLAAYLQPSVAASVHTLTRGAGIPLGRPENQGCCGLAATAAGRRQEARELAWRNITAFAGTRGPVLTSCASCSSHLATYPDLFVGEPDRQEQARRFSERVVEFSRFFLSRRTLAFSLEQSLKVFYHAPCHLRFGSVETDCSSQLLGRIRGVKIVTGTGDHCCGQGGLFQLGYPELSRRIFSRCAEGAMGSMPDVVVTSCSGCLLQWKQGAVEQGLPVRVVHSARFLAESLI